MNQPDESRWKKQRPKVPWAFVAKSVIMVLVIWGISKALRSALADLDQTPLSLQDLQWQWLIVAALFYAVAQLPLAWYWQQLLGALQIVVGLNRCLRAFVYGHLGKYVPGKMLVVIMRSGLLELQASEIPLAVSSVFVETFTFMAAGAFAASLGIACLYRGETSLQVAALIAMVCMVACTWPPLLRSALGAGQALGLADDLDISNSINTPLIAKGWAASLVAWMFNALSLYAVLRSLPMPEPVSFDATTIARLVTSLCTAVVVGFISMVPGGLLAREYVLDRLLVPHFGEVYALAAAVLLRVVWLLTELIGSTILYIAGKRSAK